MERLLFTRDHEYIRVGGDGTGLAGIGAHAVAALGGVVAVTLPRPGLTVRAGDAVAAFESVKAACEVFAPASGTVLAVNDRLLPRPDLVNSDPEGAGWLYRLQLADEAELALLLDADAYARYLESAP